MLSVSYTKEPVPRGTSDMQEHAAAPSGTLFTQDMQCNVFMWATMQTLGLAFSLKLPGFLGCKMRLLLLMTCIHWILCETGNQMGVWSC